MSQRHAMAGSGRTSSLTSGNTTSNNVFTTLFNGEPLNLDVIAYAKDVAGAIESREGQSKSAIFVRKEEDLECMLRVHAFPPKDPTFTPPGSAPVGKMHFGQAPHMYIPFRQPDDREGGRMHTHVDQTGTDAVVLLNLGSCDFTFDIDGKGHCTAQKTKECWCIGSGGHWMQKDDATSERYSKSHLKDRAGSLLKDRLCAACAAGRRGEQCRSCVKNTVRLRSGDLVVFAGRTAVHGISRVVSEDVAPHPLPGVAPLPAWAQSKLDLGWRISVQWRLTDRASERNKSEKEMKAWIASGVPAGPSRTATFESFSGHGASVQGASAACAAATTPMVWDDNDNDDDEEDELRAAIALSLQAESVPPVTPAAEARSSVLLHGH